MLDDLDFSKIELNEISMIFVLTFLNVYDEIHMI